MPRTHRPPARGRVARRSKTGSNVVRRRLADVVRERLERDIYAGIYAPGARLPGERELATQLTATRAVVREALRELEQLGIVSTRWGAARRVLDPETHAKAGVLGGLLTSAPKLVRAKSRHDSLEFRLYYGTAIAELAATKRHGQRLVELQKAVLDLKVVDDARAWFSAEARVIGALVALADNRIISLIQNTLAVAFRGDAGVQRTWWRHRKKIEAAYDGITAAIATGDAAASGRRMRELMKQELSWLAGRPRPCRRSRARSRRALR
jgi:DNA-binding FadR family transcriptional regulator